MHRLYYYFGAPDSDSADDTYDPTRECFNIDGAIASDSEDEATVEGRNTPPQVELPTKRDEDQFLADQGMQLEQIRELQDRLNEERENLRLLQQTLEQERVARAHGGGARERARDVNRRIVEDRAIESLVFG
jgi:tyrosyl-tRNA synthetase